MAIMLPSELDWILDLLGYNWPNIDEDKLQECAQAWRDFAEAVAEAQTNGSTAAGAVTAANSGEAIDKFSQTWGTFTGGVGHDSYLTDAKLAAELIAAAFDAAAIAVITGKTAVIAQLAVLAVEVIAAQAAAPFTFGLSELGALGATQATRLIVRRLLDQLKQEMMEAIANTTKDKVMDAVKKMAKDYVKDQVKSAVVDAGKEKAKEFATDAASNLAQQTIEQHFNARPGYDLSETTDIAKEKAGEYVDGIKDLADPNTHADNLKSMPQEMFDQQKEKYGGQAGNYAQDGLNRLAGRDDPAAEPAAEEEPAPTPAATAPRPAPNNNTSLQGEFG